MRVIALMNQKGGVGKTTTTVNLGAALAEAGKRVCLIDLDPQSHLTINYGVEPSADIVSLYNVLVEERPITEALHEVDKNVWLVPSSIDLAAAEIELVSILGREQILKKRLEDADFDYDYVLLDCPPSLGLLTINALAVANEVLIPMQPHFLALQGVGKLLETVQLVNRRMNPILKVCGIVLTMYDSQTKLSTEVVNDLSSFIESAKGKPLPWAAARIFKSKIRRNIKLAESPSFGQTILKYDSASNGAADYRALARELLSMEGTAVAPGAVPVELRGGNDVPAEPVAALPIAIAAPSIISPPIAIASPPVALSAPTPSFAPQPIVPTAPSAAAPAQHPASHSPFSDSTIASPDLTTLELTPQSADSINPDPTPAPPEPRTLNPEATKRKPKPSKPKLAMLVSPAEAARLKAARTPGVISKSVSIPGAAHAVSNPASAASSGATSDAPAEEPAAKS